ncbi:TetR family transcriptional regulator [Novosphingobium sp. CF614]|uniref:TetR family transcriptional regulator n=1 Tax=Novosphingobium sp. CF614 TaxID=1884364 RepID=UPI000B845BCA|nr:TetR family transcriptional regulator [Novosphingobium sp. CF614]
MSRRSAHKLRTTKILRNAAFELFLANGYDMTTTDQIAAKAGVSTRTFFRYFDSKDEVLFRGQRSWSETVSDLVKRQQADLTPMDAMCETLVKLATGVSRDALVRYERIVKSSVTLRGLSDMHHAENARRVAEALAARQGLAEPDDECTLMALVGLMLYRQAVEELRDGTRNSPIADLIREKFALLEAIYGKIVAGHAAG